MSNINLDESEVVFLSYTETKLNEAKFFLDKLEENYLKYPDSDYYLNAFIGSSRAIIWVMNSEFNKVEEWKSWYKSKEASKEEMELLRNINKLRTTSVKQHPLKTSERIELEIVEESITEKVKEQLKKLNKNTKIEFSLSSNEGDETYTINNKMENKDNESITFAVRLKKGYRVVNEFPEEDIVSVCKRYYLLLENMVKECLDKFSDKAEEYSWERTWKFTNGDILK